MIQVVIHFAFPADECRELTAIPTRTETVAVAQIAMPVSAVGSGAVTLWPRSACHSSSPNNIA